MNSLSVRKAFLVGGILSSLLYTAMVVISAMLWPSYSSSSQTISELSAYGAPTRVMWTVLGPLYMLLVSGFGWAVFQSAHRNRALRIVGSAILAYGSLGILWPFAPMHSRDVLAVGGGTLSDTIHIVLAAATVLLMLLAIACGAVAFGKRFRFYSIASLMALLTFGVLTFWDAPLVGSNLPTPWLGVWQRINVGVFLLWIAALATTLLRASDNANVPDRRDALAA